MNLTRPFLEPLAILEGANDLPDVVDETSGVLLDVIEVGLAETHDGTKRGLPRQCDLYGEPSATIVLPGPVEIKVLRGTIWYPAGQLREGATSIVLDPTRGYLGRVFLPVDATRIAVVSLAVSTAVTGGTITFLLAPLIERDA